MSSYNSINGTPTASDPYLMDDLMRQTFGFEGYFTSDCDATYEIVAGHHWQPPSWTRPLNNIERNAFAITAGEDLDCNAGYKDGYNYLDSAPAPPTRRSRRRPGRSTSTTWTLARAPVHRAYGDRRVRRASTCRGSPRPAPLPRDLGQLQRQQRGHGHAAAPGSGARAADKSIVLMKNTESLLPLKRPGLRCLQGAVLGYFANPPSMYLGGYSATEAAAGVAKQINGYNGLKNAITAIDPDATVDYMKGFTGTGTTAAALTAVDPAAIAAAANYDAVIVYAGTDGGTANEDTDRTAVTLPGAQGALITQAEAANPNTIVYMETIGPVDVRPFAADLRAAVELLQRHAQGRRARRRRARQVQPDRAPPVDLVSDIGDLPATTD